MRMSSTTESVPPSSAATCSVVTASALASWRLLRTSTRLVSMRTTHGNFGDLAANSLEMPFLALHKSVTAIRRYDFERVRRQRLHQAERWSPGSAGSNLLNCGALPLHHERLTYGKKSQRLSWPSRPATSAHEPLTGAK